MTHVDASALVLAATSRRDPAGELRRRLATEDTHAPHLVDAEYGNSSTLSTATCGALAEPAE